jgi:predicted permease
MRNEFRYALRSLLRDRGFAATVILSLALGIGANTAIFSLIDGILLRAPAYREPERLVSMAQTIPKFAKSYPLVPTNIAIYMEWRKKLASLESVGIAREATYNFTGQGQPERLNGAVVSASMMSVLGVQPVLGRNFTEQEEESGHNHVVILADSLWRRRFQADPAIVGRKIMLDGRPHDIIGVLPAGFSFPRIADLGTSLSHDSLEIYRPLGYQQRDLRLRLGDMNYWAVARLKRGVTLSQAQSELNVLESAIDKQVAGNFDLRGSMIPLLQRLTSNARQGLILVMAAVGAVLLVLVVNLANLSLARTVGRARDAAIRTALGASQSRLARQSLMESLMLAVTGGTLGILLAWWGLSALLAAAAPVDLPRLNEVRLDWRVLLFALSISVLAGVVFGVLPAVRSAIASPIETLKSGSRSNMEGRGGLRVRNLLVSIEVGLSAALLVTAGLLIASFVRVTNVNPGFQVERVLAVHVSLLQSKYGKPTDQAAFFGRLLDKAAAIPGVQSASLVSTIPLSGEAWIDLVGKEHDTRPMTELPAANVRVISPEYFQTLRAKLRDGRSFEDRDRKEKVAIVSASLAQRLWGSENPLGRKITDNDWVMEVIGVTDDLHSTSLDHDPVNILYVPYWQRPSTGSSLLLRTSQDPRRIVNTVRSAIWALDSEATIPDVRTLEEVMSSSVAHRRFQMVLVLLFAAAAISLAAIGTYGVLSYAVTRRTSEMGIRMALGAGQSDVLRMVVQQGMTPVIVGLAVGGAVALGVGRYIESLLYQVSPRDPMAFTVSAAVLLIVSVAACLIPARRATRVNPIDALRFE